jgi:hypothetical protein
VENVEVGAADRRLGYPDDRIARLLDLRSGHLVECDAAFAGEDDRLHLRLFDRTVPVGAISARTGAAPVIPADFMGESI